MSCYQNLLCILFIFITFKLKCASSKKLHDCRRHVTYMHMYRLIGLMVGARTSKGQVKIIVSENRKMPSAGFCSTKLVSEQAICDNGPSRQGRREEGQLSAGDFARSLLCNRSSVELAIAIAMPLVRSFASAKIVISFSPLCKPRKGKKYRGRGMPDFPTRRSTDRPTEVTVYLDLKWRLHSLAPLKLHETVAPKR